MRCNVILSSAAVLKKGTPTLEGVVVVSADFHEYRNCETFSDVQFAGCAFRKNLQIAGSTFENCVFYNCSFNCDFFDCKFINCRFVECVFWQISMTSILLEASEISDSDFAHCFLWALSGGAISDCNLAFCKLSEFDLHLENCRLEYVAINEPETELDDN